MYFKSALEEYFIDCKIRNLSSKTIETYKNQTCVFTNYIEDEFQINQLKDINKTHVKLFILDMQTKVSTIYINQILKVLRQAFKYFYKEEMIEKDFMIDIKNLKEHKKILVAYNDDEVASMINYFDSKKDFVSQRNKLVIQIFADCGLRVSELRELKNSSIENDYFKIIGKGGKERVVPFSEYLKNSMKKYNRTKRGYFNNLRTYREIDDYLIVNQSGKKINNNTTFENIVREASRAIVVRKEVTRQSCHSLRHYYAQKLLKSGVNLYTISRLLGHSSVKTTQTYLNSLSDAEILNDINKDTPLTQLIKQRKL